MALGDPYLSLGEFKSRIGVYDSDDDDRIQGALASASADVNEYCGRQFNDSVTPTARVFRSVNQCWAQVDDFSTTTGLVVKVGSVTGGYTTTWTVGTDFQVGPSNATFNEVPYPVFWRLDTLLGQRWPYLYREGENIQVTARWGWGSVPTNVVEATYLRAAAIVRRRDSPEGVLGGFEGNAVRVSMFNDPDMVRLLRQFRKHVPGRFGR